MHFEGWKEESFDKFGNGGEKRYWRLGGAFGRVFVRLGNGNGDGIFPDLWDNGYVHLALQDSHSQSPYVLCLPIAQ